MRSQWGERKFLHNEKFLAFHGEKVHLQKEIFQLENYLLQQQPLMTMLN